MAGIFGQQVVEALPQTAAFGIILDALGNADVVFLRKMDEETAGQRDLSGQARAFCVDGVFDDLNQDRLAFKEHVFDALGFVRIAALFEDVDDMQKRGAFQADIDERALHAGKDAFDNA